MIIASLSNSVNATVANINADFAGADELAALREWHEWTVEPPVWEEAPQPVRLVVNVAGLSADAVEYLKRIEASMKRDGNPKATRARFCNLWANGYRMWEYGATMPVGVHAAFADGWGFAKGEDDYLECMYVDACQDSAAAAGYPYGF